MGIEHLGTLMAQHGVKNDVRTLPTFKGKTITMDGTNIVSIYLATAHRAHVEDASLTDLVHPADPALTRRKVVESTIERTIRFIQQCLEHKVTPVWIIDARTPPPDMVQAKAATRAKRAEAKARDKAKAEQLRSLLIAYETQHGTLEGGNTIEAAVHLFLTSSATPSSEPLKKGEVDPTNLAALDKAYRTVMSRTYSSFNQNEMDELVSLLDALGIAVYEASDEGERLAAYLVRAGLADAVYSTDTDCLAHGAPVHIRSMSTVAGNNSFLFCEVARLDEIRKKLPQCPTQARFVDLCILLGCDFNTHIKGMGPVNALKQHALHFLDGPSGNEANELNRDWCRAFFLGVPEGADEMTRDDLAFRPKRALDTDTLPVGWRGLMSEVQATIERAWF